jgi:hypothetical protein
MPYRDMPSYYSPSQVAAILQKSPTTVRRLTATYAAHLSEEATPVPGRPRQYTVEDVAILKAASDATDQRQDVDTIRSSLATIALPEPTADLANVATSLPQPTTAPLQPMQNVDALTHALDRHTIALERFATALTVFGVCILAIVLLAIAAGVGWL